MSAAGGRTSFDTYQPAGCPDAYGSHLQQLTYMVGTHSTQTSGSGSAGSPQQPSSAGSQQGRGSYHLGPDMSPSSRGTGGSYSGGSNFSSSGGRQSSGRSSGGGPYSMASHHGGGRSGGNNTLSGPVEANPNLYVHNVPKDSNEEELRGLFGRYGTVERVRLKVNQKVGPHAVYAFVTFSSTAEAQVALSNLQGTDIRGRALRIEFQRTTNGPTGGGGSNGPAGGGQHHESSSPGVNGSSSYHSPSNASSYQSGSSGGSGGGFHSLGGGFMANSMVGGPSQQQHSATGAGGSPSHLPANYNPATASGTPPQTQYAQQPQQQPLQQQFINQQTPSGQQGDTLQSFSSWPQQQLDPSQQPGGAPSSSGWGASAQQHQQQQLMSTAMNGLPPHQRSGSVGGPGGSTHLRDYSGGDYMPPTKRGRFQSPSLRPEAGPTGGGAEAHDVATLLSTLHQVVSGTKPEALNLVQSLSQMLLAGSGPSQGPAGGGSTFAYDRWPDYNLSGPQRHIAQSGALKLDTATNRWQVSLTSLLETLKPQLFGVRPGATGAPSMQQQQQPGDLLLQQQAAPLVPPTSVPISQGWGPTPVSQQQPSGGPMVSGISGPVPESRFAAAEQDVSKQSVAPVSPQQPVQVPSKEASLAQWKTWLAALPVATESPATALPVWSGTLAKNDKKRTPVAMRRLVGNVEKYLLISAGDNYLNISHRSTLDEVCKKELGAVGVLSPSTPETAKAFLEYVAYFEEKYRAGVVRLEGSEYQLIYLIPKTISGVAAMFGSLLEGLPNECLLAVVARSPTATETSTAVPSTHTLPATVTVSSDSRPSSSGPMGQHMSGDITVATPIAERHSASIDATAALVGGQIASSQPLAPTSSAGEPGARGGSQSAAPTASTA